MVTTPTLAPPAIFTPPSPTSLDNVAPRVGELPRPPVGPTEVHERQRGGGGVLGEYAMLIDFDLSQVQQIARTGYATYERLQLVLEVLSDPIALEQIAPISIDFPTVTVDLPTDTDTDETDPPPPPPVECPSWAVPNSILPVPGTYQGQSVPGGALADINRREPGSRAGSLYPAGFRPQPSSPEIDRGHLIAKQFGGKGGATDGGTINIVAMFKTFNNNKRQNPGMRNPEEFIERAILSCQSWFVDISLAYNDWDPDTLWSLQPPELPVDLIHYQAVTSGGMFYNEVLENRDMP